MIASQPKKLKDWSTPELRHIGDISDVAGGPAPSTQLNPGGNLVSGKS